MGMCVFISRKVLSRRRSSPCGRLASWGLNPFFLPLCDAVLSAATVCFMGRLIKRKKERNTRLDYV